MTLYYFVVQTKESCNMYGSVVQTGCFQWAENDKNTQHNPNSTHTYLIMKIYRSAYTWRKIVVLRLWLKWLCFVRMISTHQAMSKTGPLCPPTKGTCGFSLPTLAWGRMRKAPPPPDSTITATNFGLTAQNVESHELLDTLKTFNPIQNYKHHQIRSWFWTYLHLKLNWFLFQGAK